MNNAQHLLEKIINTDFLILDSQIDLTALKEKIIRESPTKIFLRDPHTIQCVHISATTGELLYETCPVHPITIPIERIVSTLTQENNTLLIEYKSNYVGYVNTEIFSKNLLNEYQQRQAYLDTILQTIDESCTVIDRQANVMYWTKGAEKIFSIKKDDIIGNPITDFFSSDQLEILNSLKTGSSVYHRQHNARNDLVVLINSNPVYYNDEIIGAVVSETDITSQIRLNNELYMTSEKLFTLEEEVRKSLPTDNPFIYIRGNSPALKQTISIAKKAATTNVSILIYGESGVGKELFAKAMHNLREEPNAPFVAINCGAIPSGLFESEIFGYEKGAFSGADQKGKKGKVELARGGTLFLDEIGEMPLEMQVKILRLLQEKRFYPVGGTKEIEADFRVVAATNRDLKELVNEGKFREDLYYRLNVVNFKVPPLRERPEDIIELTYYFLYEISVKYNRPIHGISQAVMQSLLQHPWPGNIRELRNVVERLVVFSDNGNIKIEDLPNEMERISNPSSPTPDVQSGQLAVDKNQALSVQLQQYEKDIILRELNKVNGNKLECAKNLNITRATLYNRMNKLGIKL
ncbi:sigma 54-interacting transcriptional regulator [Sporosarcina luteola]|uniref:sigma-54 interaction domain-containing protein n=1 Tax=Sporosarcina luteola TaxID=582850 RepID=UPI002040862F|nr:sigma 54-interacting transcriptional regulator [Sporosarcina luteola]MCM3745037.1 sigma 54-interacting transcriptional regulator [Sporosarcina luteola]